MTHPNPSTALARVVVDQLAAHGVRSVYLSPGSRSGALAIAAADHDDIDLTVVIDERSASFHALGAARASGSPSAVICTSGTAAANFFPAVVEADMSCVPLVVVTADRPFELRGVGANQTIDQVELYGSKVRAFEELAEPEPLSDANEVWRDTVDRALGVALFPKPGPVQLNVAFREPTVPVTDDGRTRGESYPFATPRIAPAVGAATGSPMTPMELTPEAGLVVAGDGEYDRSELMARSADLGWPVLATALSGLRGRGVVMSYGRILADGVPGRLRPRTVVAAGAIGPDSRLEDLVATAETRVRVDRWGRIIDPRRNATHVLAADPVALLSELDGHADATWREAWLEAEASARDDIDLALESVAGLTGGAVAAALNDVGWGSLVVASSLPIREIDAHLTRRGPVYANRGASGIDGFVSTAMGVAAVTPRALALAGDLSLLHDANGFLHDGDVDLTMVVIDNGGGGLFDALPQAQHAPRFERLFVTPPNRDLEKLARFHDVSFSSVKGIGSLVETVSAALDAGGAHLVRVPVDRQADLRFRRQLFG
ncbi:MAG: 2-succinyl-5-enolpyruvyl-6-hydroxy-3-cyclohexene-1-carboxylic-acid synthase [Acidimicrobiia bacterium]|jgi:2-succinyl-5-enolpyruvyl-6-hydroxy-3-cyclohexene-1-carboxylate synthase